MRPATVRRPRAPTAPTPSPHFTQRGEAPPPPLYGLGARPHPLSSARERRSPSRKRRPHACSYPSQISESAIRVSYPS